MRLIDRAIACHRAGDLAQAESLCRQVLSTDNRDFDALHVLGMVCAQRLQWDDAERLLRGAIAVNPQSTSCCHTYGNVLAALGRFEDAINIYNKALATVPDSAPLYSDCGNAKTEIGDFDGALASYARALAIMPDLAEAWLGRGNIFCAREQFDRALAEYDEALRLDPDLAPGWLGRGNVFNKIERHHEALAAYDQALTLAPDLAEAWLGRGNALAAIDRYDDALETYERALTLSPNLAEAWLGCGNVFNTLRRHHDALVAHRNALACQTDLVESWLGCGVALDGLRRFAEAGAAYDKAFTFKPDDAEMHVAAGCRHLRIGEFEVGWREYDWRMKLSEWAPWWRESDKPCWRGNEDIAGKTVLLRCEQGYGDTIHFCRYADMVAAKGARVILEVQPELTALMRRSLTGCDQIIGRGEPLPAFDVQCALMTLPLAFDTTLETIPSKTPYLSSCPEQAERWRQRLGPKKGLRVGLVWSGSPTQASDKVRSVPLEFYRPLSIPGVQLVSLQRDVRDSDQQCLQAWTALPHFGEELHDFSVTAGLVANMDLVVTVCTSVGHLAAAMNKPTWFVLSDTACWRWLLDRDDSPWYPSARLFRQSSPGDWSEVVAGLVRELHRMTRSARLKSVPEWLASWTGRQAVAPFK